MKMRREIEEQFNKIAGEYDENRRKFIPCFDDFYQKTTDFITSNIDAPNRVIDLGAGTGLLTESPLSPQQSWGEQSEQ
jgi:ubiquinone/menaquinone biosynthesis C-methylase UbiE